MQDPENRELPTQVADNRNGTFNVQWTPEDVGPHSINVSYGGQPVSNSPFPVQAKPTGNPHGVIAPGKFSFFLLIDFVAQFMASDSLKNV